MNEIEYIKEKIQYCIDMNLKHIVVVPMGKWGQKVKELLNTCYKIKEDFCLDNIHYDGKNVYPINEALLNERKNTYLLSVQDECVKREIMSQLLQFVDQEQIIDVFSNQIFIQKMWNVYGRVKMDFLLVGFMKCGTSSLQRDLLCNPKIYLPSEKETFFIHNLRSENAYERFRKSYPEDKLNEKVVGGIEPTYSRFAKEVYEYFGADLKILMCVRNPIEAVYSFFLMDMRNALGKTIYYLSKYGNITPEVFEEWLEENKAGYVYIRFIKEYLKFYSKEQIRIIIFEELCQNPNKEMKEIQEFIGVAQKDILEYNAISHVNEGFGIPKNLACAYINRNITQLFYEGLDPDLWMEILRIQNEIFEITNEKHIKIMTDSMYKKLFEFYKESIEELELFLGKSLNGLWYNK